MLVLQNVTSHCCCYHKNMGVTKWSPT